MKTIEIVEKKICCGCRSCVQTCPAHCINMAEDSEGFLYPQINKSLCLHCGNCYSACPTINSVSSDDSYDSHFENFKHIAYAVKCKDSGLLASSASGGIFSIIANWVLSRNGVVFGATFDSSWRVIHEPVMNHQALGKLRKSKYVQSDTQDCYKEAQKLLQKGITVLYSGTPCQIAGLKKFLGSSKYENLICVEIICHGVPSPKVWRRYISELEEHFEGNLLSYDFRYKQKRQTEVITGIENYGWKSPKVRAEFDNGKIFQIFFEKDVFTGGFAQNLYLRPSCYLCQWNYSILDSISDYTIGDYYGIEKEHPNFDYEMGASAVIINTHKGKKLFEMLLQDLDFLETTVEKISNRNIPLLNPPKKHKNRERFFVDFINNNYTSLLDLIRQSLGYNFKQKITFGVLGSYNARWAVWNLLVGSDSELLFHFSNSSIISMVSEPVSNLRIDSWPGNNFRKGMLKADLNKTFFRNIDKEEFKTDYVIIDLLEERFSVYESTKSENVCFTDSDALQDADALIDETWEKLSDKEACLKWEKAYIELEKKLNSKIILLELFLCELYEAVDGNLKQFENLKMIKAINERLHLLYDMIKKRNNIFAVISLPKDYFWCKHNHRHGILPCHLNDLAYNEITEQLFKLVKGDKKC